MGEPNFDQLKGEVKRLKEQLRENQDQLREAQETIEAIRTGSVDAIVKSTTEGEQVFILKGSDQPYRNLIEKMSEGALIISKDNTILYCNDGFAKMVVAPLDKVIGTNIVEWVSSAEADKIPNYIPPKTKNYKTVFQTTFFTKTGKTIPAQVSIGGLSMDSVSGTSLIITDLSNHMEQEIKSYTEKLEQEITQRKQAEEALTKSERKYRSLFNSIDEGFCIIEMIFDDNCKPIDYKFIELNPQFEKHTGLYDANGKLARSIVPSLDELWFETYGEVALTGNSKRFINYSIPLKRWFDVFAFPVSEGVYQVGVLFTDITKRKQAEDALKENERLYRTIFDNSEDGFQLVELIYDNEDRPVDFRYLKVNNTFERIVGVKANDIIGKRASEIFPDYSRKWLEIPAKVAQTGQALRIESYSEFQKKYFDLFYFSYDLNKVGTLFRDVSERVNLQMQLKVNERLAAIGETAGMVGHDIRNPLQAIISELYLAKSDLELAPDSDWKSSIQECITSVEKEIDYINKIVADLQDFARTLKPELVEVSDLCNVIKESLLIITVPNNIVAAMKCRMDLPKLKLDLNFFKRILINLVTNAIQAMPDGGKLTINAFEKDNNVFITVEDTGIGIPERIKHKLFTPMLTTKAKGQGLGLAVVKRLVEAQGGAITFESQEGKGTTFTLRFLP
jgi:PAS domain S-box-containing protein